MNTFDALKTYNLNNLDPRGGIIVYSVHWRPRAGDPHPEFPGEKISILAYLTTNGKGPLLYNL
jgi:hypothetical protein